ncbi:MAG: Uma2 family endonuclease [Actinomycetota bacterium]|nr:Uma2 family endonuclease [Actinomycetota bacterium]
MDDYHRMAAADVFGPEDRVELIDGEVVEMTPIGSRHAGCVNRLTRLLTASLGERAIVAVQNPIQVGDLSEPQPDLVLLRPRPDFYAEHHAMPPDILLVIEAAETSLRFDLERKAPLYMAGGIPEVWIVDLVAGVINVTTATGSRQAGVGDAIAPEAFPDVVLQVADILP